MSKRSGEQSRRAALRQPVLRTHAERYAAIMAVRDRQRLVQALRDEANRLETNGKFEKALLERAPRPDGVPSVTDHAVVRFLERVMGLDVDAIRRQIARVVPKESLPSVLEGVGSHGVVWFEGYQFLVTPHSIITVLTAEMDSQCWLDSAEAA